MRPIGNPPPIKCCPTCLNVMTKLKSGIYVCPKHGQPVKQRSLFDDSKNALPGTTWEDIFR